MTSPQVKLCPDCNFVKPLETGFYRAGTKNYQSRCKPCHNKRRNNYAPSISNQTYIKKKIGFEKLDEKIQKNIIYDLYVKLNFKKISQKYNLNHTTTMRWRRTGKIPDYVPTEDDMNGEVGVEYTS